MDTFVETPDPVYELPDLIRVNVRCNGKPMSQLFVRVTIVTCRKNDFELMFGPSNGSGDILVRRDDLLREASRDREFFIMDYGHPEADYAGTIKVTPMNLEAVEGAIDAYRLFHRVGAYPNGYIEGLDAARRLLDSEIPVSLSIVLTAEGGTGQVVRVDG